MPSKKTPHERAVLDSVARVYAARRDRKAHPEGSFDGARRWYPSDAEDCGGSGSKTRSPTWAWPYSYMLRCRTRQHCAVLVAAYCAGRPVPEDVREACQAAGICGEHRDCVEEPTGEMSLACRRWNVALAAAVRLAPILVNRVAVLDH